jgi:hypothetical protein
VGGDQDVFYLQEMFVDMYQCIPDSKLILYSGVGHGALEFRKNKFDQDVMRFLAGDA